MASFIFRAVLSSALALAAVGFAPGARAEDTAQAPQGVRSVVKSQQGLHFNVPPDWPIEERNGVVAPIPLEEYLGMKFNQMTSRLNTLEQQVTSYDLRMRVLEEQLKAIKPQSLRSAEGNR